MNGIFWLEVMTMVISIVKVVVLLFVENMLLSRLMNLCCDANNPSAADDADVQSLLAYYSGKEG